MNAPPAEVVRLDLSPSESLNDRPIRCRVIPLYDPAAAPVRVGLPPSESSDDDRPIQRGRIQLGVTGGARLPMALSPSIPSSSELRVWRVPPVRVRRCRLVVSDDESEPLEDDGLGAAGHVEAGGAASDRASLDWEGGLGSGFWQDSPAYSSAEDVGGSGDEAWRLERRRAGSPPTALSTPWHTTGQPPQRRRRYRARQPGHPVGRARTAVAATVTTQGGALPAAGGGGGDSNGGGSGDGLDGCGCSNE